MVEIPTLDPSEAPRARRWDALVLGSGLPACSGYLDRSDYNQTKGSI